MDAHERPSRIIAWDFPGGTQCVLGVEQGRWVVTIEWEDEVIARSQFSTADEALAHADRQRRFFVHSKQP